MQKCPLFWSKLDIFPVFCEILQNPPLFEKIPQFPILKNLSPLLGQKSHKTGKFPPFGHTGSALFQHYAIFFSKIFRNCLIAPLWVKTKTSVCMVLIYWSFAVGWQMNSLRGKIGYFGRTTPALSFLILGERNTHKSPSFNWGQSKRKCDRNAFLLNFQR